MIIQFSGLSGAGKSTIAMAVETRLTHLGIKVEIIDGDEYRTTLCKGLGFSQQERAENIRRMAFVAHQLSKHGIIAIICAINPIEAIRQEVSNKYPDVVTVFIDCPVEILKLRDTKGLYKRAFLPLRHPDKINNLTGINAPFEKPVNPDIYINTSEESIIGGANKVVSYITGGVTQMPLFKSHRTMHQPL